MDKQYWNSYYQSYTHSAPSDFAIFCLNNYINKYDTLVDIGCGDFRDSKFFADNGIKVLACDQVYFNTIPDNIIYINSDITLLPIINAKHYYMRWLLHALNEFEESELLLWLQRCQPNSKLLIECRSTNDKTQFTEDHYRRLIDFNALKEKIKLYGFSIQFAAEDENFSKINNENNPCLIRLIAIKL